MGTDRTVSDLAELDEKKIAIYTAEAARRQKSVGLAYVLLIFFGAVGIHQFYLGRVGKGVVYVICTFLGWIFLVAGFGGAVASGTEEETAAASSTFMVGCLALAVVGVMVLWDLFTLSRQVRKRDDRMRAKLIEQLQERSS